MDEIDWDYSEPIEYLEMFAYPGEIPELAKLARRFLYPTVPKDDFHALKDGLFPLADALEEAGYKWDLPGKKGWTVLDFAFAAIGDVGEDDWTLPTWRALAALSYAEVERIIRFVKRGWS